MDKPKSIATFFLAAILILVPIFFLPLTTDFFGFNKQVLFILLTSVSLVFWLIHSILQKSVRLTLSPLLLPLILLAATAVASTYLAAADTAGAWLGRTSLYLTLTVFFIMASTLIQTPRQVRNIITGQIIVAAILAILGLASTTGLLEGSSYFTSRSFSPAGSLLVLVSYLIITLPLSLTLAFKIRSGPEKLYYFLFSGIILAATILIGYQFLPGQTFTPTLLPKLAGWSIATDTFKSNALLGSGPGSFLQQFSQFKPVSLNFTPFWQVGFTVSANEYLHLMTTLGLAGIAAFLLTIIGWGKLVKRQPGTRITATQAAVNLATATALILALFIPFTVVTLTTLIGLFSFSVALNKTKNLKKVKDVLVTINTLEIVDPDQPTAISKDQTNVLPYILAAPIGLGLVIAGINLTRAYAAEVAFKQSLDTLAQNQGKATYDLQIAAIAKNPKVDRYRVAYANTNLALANSIAAQSELTDQDREQVTQLIQQAIREARTATQLNPQKALNWTNLGNVYRQLVNFADGADQFAVAAYIRAIQLDPANPVLRVQLGGLYYSLKQYDQAIDRFREAIELKPDYANGYYNLSYAYRDSGKTLEAYQAMQQVVALVPADSDDAVKAQDELNQLKSQLPATATQPQASPQPDQLSQPSPLPSPPSGFEPIPAP